MMLKDKICVSKRLLLVFFITVILPSSLVLFSNTLSSGKRTLSSKAELNKIIGGRDAMEGEFPFVALVTYEPSYQMCTGVLIDPEWVLTAAHCVYKSQENYLYVSVNMTNIKSAQNKYIKVYPIIHEKYDSDTVANDIALLRLEEKVTDVVPASLPSRNWTKASDYMYYPGTEVTVVGWGCVGISPMRKTTINPDSSNPNYFIELGDKLQVVTLPISSQKFPYHFAVGYDDDRSKNKSVCFGDSGSPVLYGTDHPNILIGINSLGAPSNWIGPGGAVKINDYLSWIQDTMKSNPSSCIDINNGNLPIPIMYDNSTSEINSGTYVYQDCVYDMKTREKSGLSCYHNLPNYKFSHVVLPASKKSKCYVPALSDCLSNVLSNNGALQCSKVGSISESEPVVEYGNTYRDTQQRIYKCQCTHEYTYPVLKEVR
jgi:V8-like Glu-specific endopeptidase